MACGTSTVYPGKQNKGLSSTFESTEEGQSVQLLKRDKHGNKNEDNSPKNVNNIHNTSSQKYRQINTFYNVVQFQVFLSNIYNKYNIYLTQLYGFKLLYNINFINVNIL